MPSAGMCSDGLTLSVRAGNERARARVVVHAAAAGDRQERRRERAHDQRARSSDEVEQLQARHRDVRLLRGLEAELLLRELRERLRVVEVLQAREVLGRSAGSGPRSTSHARCRAPAGGRRSRRVIVRMWSIALSRLLAVRVERAVVLRTRDDADRDRVRERRDEVVNRREDVLGSRRGRLLNVSPSPARR